MPWFIRGGFEKNMLRHALELSYPFLLLGWWQVVVENVGFVCCIDIVILRGVRDLPLSWKVQKGKSHISKPHPRQRLSTQKIKCTGSLGSSKRSHIHQHDHPAFQPRIASLRIAQILHCAGSNHAAVRVRHDYNLLPVVDELLDHTTGRVHIIGEVLGGRLSAGGRQGDGSARKSPGGEDLADGVKCLGEMPCSRDEHDGGLFCAGHGGCTVVLMGWQLS